MIYNQNTGESDWICVDTFINEYSSLKFGVKFYSL